MTGRITRQVEGKHQHATKLQAADTNTHGCDGHHLAEKTASVLHCRRQWLWLRAQLNYYERQRDGMLLLSLWTQSYLSIPTHSVSHSGMCYEITCQHLDQIRNFTSKAVVTTENSGAWTLAHRTIAHRTIAHRTIAHRALPLAHRTYQLKCV